MSYEGLSLSLKKGKLKKQGLVDGVCKKKGNIAM
jgi:hypothetical protein